MVTSHENLVITQDLDYIVLNLSIHMKLLEISLLSWTRKNTALEVFIIPWMVASYHRLLDRVRELNVRELNVCEAAVPLILNRITIDSYQQGKTNLSHDDLNPAHIFCWRVNNPTLGEFYFPMIERADIKGSKSDIAMNAWPPQTSYSCGNFSNISC